MLKLILAFDWLEDIVLEQNNTQKKNLEFLRGLYIEIKLLSISNKFYVVLSLHILLNE